MQRLVPVALCLVVAGAAIAPGDALAWHGWRRHYRYLTVRAAPVVLPGYHCPLGQWWRPSMRVCQGTPVAIPRPEVAVAPAPPVPMSQAPLPPVMGTVGDTGARTVSTDTRVVGRRRWLTRDGSTTTYTVVTRVVERSPRGR